MHEQVNSMGSPASGSCLLLGGEHLMRNHRTTPIIFAPTRTHYAPVTSIVPVIQEW